MHGKEYKKAGEDQYFYTTGENFDRGAINFSNLAKSSAPAVHMTNEYDLAIDPKTFKSAFENKKSGASFEDYKKDAWDRLDSAFQKFSPKGEEALENSGEDSSTEITKNISQKAKLPEYEIFKKKLEKESSFEILAINVNEDIANAIIAEKIRGVIVNRKKSRVYFEKEIGAKVLGFVGFAGNSRTGLYGIEKYYNDVLEKEGIKNTNFFAEVFADFNSERNEKEDIKSILEKNKKQGDLNLTIDVSVERYLHKILSSTRDRWSSENIGGIVMDINDGSIIAMEEVPSYDPNKYGEVSDISLYNNDLISGVYEMGSIIKPLTVAAALDSNTVNENTTYNDTGSISLNGYTIYNFDKKARGTNTTIQQILSQSLNVGIAFLVQKMGNEELGEYFHKFGIGEHTGIDLPNESSGLVSNLESDVVVDSVTAGFGQGIAITPIQTIRALATLGNGGRLVTPHIVKSITYDSGETKIIAQDEGEMIFQNASTSERITKLLIKVVDEGMHAKNPKYTVAAKTGTAQMVNSATGKYYEDKYLHSFFGYFPATDPKYIIFLYHTDPRGAQYASQTLKETFLDLVNFLIGYYEIPPDR